MENPKLLTGRLWEVVLVLPHTFALSYCTIGCFSFDTVCRRMRSSLYRHHTALTVIMTSICVFQFLFSFNLYFLTCNQLVLGQSALLEHFQHPLELNFEQAPGCNCCSYRLRIDWYRCSNAFLCGLVVVFLGLVIFSLTTGKCKNSAIWQ